MTRLLVIRECFLTVKEYSRCPNEIDCFVAPKTPCNAARKKGEGKRIHAPESFVTARRQT